MARGAENETYMDIPGVQGISKTLAGVAQALRAVEAALTIMIQALFASLFVGNVGAAAQIKHLQETKRQVDQMADKIEEMVKDVDTAVAAYERGDAEGATKFH